MQKFKQSYNGEKTYNDPNFLNPIEKRLDESYVIDIETECSACQTKLSLHEL